MKFMHKKNAFIAAAMLGLSCTFGAYLPSVTEAAGYLAPQEQAIKVLPIDNAKFLQGQRFDFAIEIKNGDTNMDVKVNGQDAAKFFGKTATKSM